MKSKTNYLIVWVMTFVASCLFLYYGNKMVSKDLHVLNNTGYRVEKALVTKVTETHAEETAGVDQNVPTTVVSFECRLLNGEEKGKTVEATQMIESIYQGNLKAVEQGDQILLYGYDDGNAMVWSFSNYIRINTIFVLGIIFVLLILLIGKAKGINTIVSLAVTCLAVFFVFIPSVLNGYNVYLSSSIICGFTIVTTLIFVNGVCKKSIAAMLGCSLGVGVAAVLTAVMSKLLHLTGILNEESYYLTMIDGKSTIDVKSVIFGCIIIGALGAIMDVSMDIASSLHEIKRHKTEITFSGLYKSGMEIGRDLIGTMSNTLVLAYIGSSLSSILLLFTYSANLFEVLNREMIIVDLLQALIGSLGILLTIPFTAFVSAILYSNGYTGEHEEREANTEDQIFW